MDDDFYRIQNIIRNTVQMSFWKDIWLEIYNTDFNLIERPLNGIY